MTRRASLLRSNGHPMVPIVHFVGFRGDEYTRAVRIWGRPHYVHYVWDRRAQRDIAPCDTVVFARGDAGQPVGQWNGPDILE
jgi:hypothetical protein